MTTPPLRARAILARAGLLSLALAVFQAPAVAAADADIQAGKARAAGCAGCHGANGIAPSPNFPNLAGQKAGYLAIALKAYRDKVRTDPIMNGMAASLSDSDVANLAAYYASLPRH